MRMPHFDWLLIVIAVTISGNVIAEDASVTILSPAEGAMLNVKSENDISYEIKPGPKGDHSHLYVDGKEIAVLRKLKGTYTFPGFAAAEGGYNSSALTVGERNICIKVVNKGHTPIGVEKCIKVMVK